MTMIFSADRGWGIGRDNMLLFHASEDMKRFKELTKGKVVVMGYNTLLSLPGSKPLPDRVNIVLSRKSGLKIEGAHTCAGLDDLFEEIERYPEEDVFVIGGEQVYRQLMPYSGKAYVTKFDAEAQADRFMENLDDSHEWKLIETSDTFEDGGLEYTFNTYIHLEYGVALP
ncbi:dihydrofolate reductase [Clostridia bacterium]|nr:dihydrofolate reductase [Clostridia bacterium]